MYTITNIVYTDNVKVILYYKIILLNKIPT